MHAGGQQVSEQRFRTLFEQAPFSVQLLGVDGRTLQVNGAWKELWGIGESDPVFAWIFGEYNILTDPQLEAKGVLPYLRRAFAGSTVRIPATHYDPAEIGRPGRARWVEATASPIKSADGQVAEVMLIHEDVTERMLAQEQLRFQRDLTRLITDNATTAIFMMDTQSRCTFMNPAAERMTGFTFAEVERSILHDFIHHHHPDGRPYPMSECPIDRALPEHFDVVGHQDVFIRKNGDFFPVEVNAKPIRDGAVEIGTVIEVRDLTAERKAMQRLRELTNRLSEADRRKDEFLATLAHELRNPLSPIRTAATMLLSDKLRGDQLAWAARIIQRQVGHMAKMLDDLLDVARITRGKLAIERRVVPLRDVVDAAVETARSLIVERRHDLQVQLPHLDLCIWADPVRASQILSNLLVNAARYTEPGGKIELAATSSGHDLVVLVKDNGIGMEAQDVEGVFEMFSQGRHPSPASGAGLGIGLALSKALAELHGGFLSARSAGPGQGSSFELRLPGAVRQGHSPQADPQAEAARRMRVLVVDDNRDAADTLAVFLEMDGHDTRVAYGGMQALKIAFDFRPDGAIVDIGMPDMTGYEVARAFRREVWGRNVMLAALTGWGQVADKQLAIEAGFDTHLTKPADTAELRALLASWAKRAGA